MWPFKCSAFLTLFFPVFLDFFFLNVKQMIEEISVYNASLVFSNVAALFSAFNLFLSWECGKTTDLSKVMPDVEEMPVLNKICSFRKKSSFMMGTRTLICACNKTEVIGLDMGVQCRVCGDLCGVWGGFWVFLLLN